MILRRFTRHFTEQNWFAVGLDVIVVVVGIFLGLQVQAWYDGRAAVEDERRIVGYMISDMENTLNFLDNEKLVDDVRINLSNKAIDILESGVLKPEDKEDFEDALIRQGRTRALDPYLNSFDDENLSRIIDSDLRRVIGNYLSRVRRLNNIIKLTAERMSRAKVVRDAKTPIRSITDAEDIVYYNFDQLKNDDLYLASIINMNGAQQSFKVRSIAKREISQLLLQILIKYQAGESIEVVLFETS